MSSKKSKAKEAPKRAEPIVLRKITNKHVMTGERIPIDEEMPLFTVYGVIRKYKPGESDYGEYIKFFGDFKAVRYSDGQEFVAPSLIVTTPMDQMLVNSYEDARSIVNEENGNKADAFVQCEFAIEIGVEAASTPTGYQWTSRSLLPMKKNEALVGIEAQLGSIPALMKLEDEIEEGEERV